MGTGVVAIVASAVIRAATLRAMLVFMEGWPMLSADEMAPISARYVSKRDARFAQLATDADFALMNACLEVEDEYREHEFASVEHLLALVQWEVGDLDERILALPDQKFVPAAIEMYAIGWAHPAPGPDHEPDEPKED